MSKNIGAEEVDVTYYLPQAASHHRPPQVTDGPHLTQPQFTNGRPNCAPPRPPQTAGHHNTAPDAAEGPAPARGGDGGGGGAWGSGRGW